jgi:hypothetical protein
MPLTRLLAIVVLCTASASAQQQPLASNQASSNVFEVYNYLAAPPAATPSEPWRIIPEQSEQPQQSKQADSTDPTQSQLSNSDTEKRTLDVLNTLERLMAEHYIDPSEHPWVKVSPDGKVMAWGVDETCYSIRSYVVARDNKDSDAVHPVSESTCQPASRYGVHTAEQRVRLSNGEEVH